MRPGTRIKSRLREKGSKLKIDNESKNRLMIGRNVNNSAMAVRGLAEYQNTSLQLTLAR